MRDVPRESERSVFVRGGGLMAVFSVSCENVFQFFKYFLKVCTARTGGSRCKVDEEYYE